MKTCSFSSPTSLKSLGVRTNRARKQGGMSLPMMALFLAVGLIVIVAAVTYGPRYLTKAQAGNEYQAYQTFHADMVSYRAKVGAFTATNASKSALAALGFWPQSMITGTPAAPVITNQFNGDITVSVASGNSLYLYSTNLPNAVCAELATSIDNIAGTISVNGTATKALGAATDPAAVATACVNSAGNSLTVQVL